MASLPRIRRVDATNLTFGDVLDYSDTLLESFKDDFMRVKFAPPAYRFQEKPKSPKDAVAEAKAYRRYVHAHARHFYTSVRDGKIWFYILSDENGLPMAVSAWLQPTFVDPLPVTQSWYYRLWTFILKKANTVLDFFVFFGSQHPLFIPDMAAEFEWGTIACEADTTPERVKVLEETPFEEQKSKVYPQDFTYFCKILAVRSSAQGKSYGRTLLQHTIDELPHQAPKFGAQQGVRKASLFSSPVAAKFYERFGFSLVASHPHALKGGVTLTHRYFQMNL